MVQTVFEKACSDIDENLWVLSSTARTRIKGWFMAIDHAGYERGLAQAADVAAKAALPPIDVLGP